MQRLDNEEIGGEADDEEEEELEDEWTDDERDDDPEEQEVKEERKTAGVISDDEDEEESDADAPTQPLVPGWRFHCFFLFEIAIFRKKHVFRWFNSVGF